MIFKYKEIFDFMPLIKPRISLSGDISEVGTNKISKFYTAPVSRTINLEYFLKSLEMVRKFESFWIKNLGRWGSFYLPSFKRDFVATDKFKQVSFFNAKISKASFGIFEQTLNLIIPAQNFASKVIDVRLDKEKNCEIIVLENRFDFEINESSFISELILVRFNSDSFKVLKKGAVGYYLSLDFKEVFYE